MLPRASNAQLPSQFGSWVKLNDQLLRLWLAIKVNMIEYVFNFWQVTFVSGTWVVSSGIYLLVACSKGHALVSSSDGVSFLQGAQRCIACGKNQYIINTNNSLFSCQPCPAGAECDGSDLKAKVQGSIWSVSNSTKQYVLDSCPPGYELQNLVGGVFSYAVQQCEICPTRFFCPGAAASRLPCPGSSFSPPGSSTVGSCADVVIVESVVAILMAVADFDASKKRAFVSTFALACGIPGDHVVITSITSSHQRSEVSIQV
jgi:hypothetical protein